MHEKDIDDDRNSSCYFANFLVSLHDLLYTSLKPKMLLTLFPLIS